MALLAIYSSKLPTHKASVWGLSLISEINLVISCGQQGRAYILLLLGEIVLCFQAKVVNSTVQAY